MWRTFWRLLARRRKPTFRRERLPLDGRTLRLSPLQRLIVLALRKDD
jgi:hypothetical protein